MRTTQSALSATGTAPKQGRKIQDDGLEWQRTMEMQRPTIDNEVIIRSAIRKADNPIHPNRRVRSRDDEKFKLESETDGIGICMSQLNLPDFDAQEVIGKPTSRTSPQDKSQRAARRRKAPC